MQAINWGDVPTWVSAITTLGALIAAGAVVYVELRRDKRSLEASERGAQADAVAVWWSATPYRAVTTRNGSSLPIYDVSVTAVLRESAGTNNLPPYAMEVLTYNVTRETLLPPGDQSFGFEPDDHDGLPKNTTHARRVWGYSIEFSDVAGRRWIRTVDGVLERLN